MRRWNVFVPALKPLLLSAIAALTATAATAAAPPAAACGRCAGKLTQLTLRYTGAAPAVSVQVFQRAGEEQSQVFAGTVHPGEPFRFSGKDRQGTLGTSVRIFVGNAFHAAISTSCEDDTVGPGFTAGDFEVIDGASRNGGALCPIAGPRSAAALRATLAAELLTDADGSRDVSPGDTLRYTAVVTNPGNRRVGNVAFLDAPAPATRLLPGSVTTTRGTVSSGNGAADTVVILDLGELAAGARATISFRVKVGTLPAGATALANQGFASGAGVPGVPTDDPATPQVGDPTRSVLGTRPLLEALLTAGSSGEGEAGTKHDEGGTLAYTATVRNRGLAAATGVVFTDAPAAPLRLVARSVGASQGTVTTGNGRNDKSVLVSLGTLAPGAAATVTFRLSIDSPLPQSTGAVANQGRITTHELPAGLATDDPTTLALGDPTVTPLGGNALLRAVQYATLLVDADGDGQVGPGDAVRYVVVASNAGQGDGDGHAEGNAEGHAEGDGEGAGNLLFGDSPDAHTALVPGTVATSAGTVIFGNVTGDSQVLVSTGTLPRGQSTTIAFTVGVRSPLPLGVLALSNQGTWTTGGQGPLATDDPGTPAVGDPTVTPLAVAAIGDFVWNDRNGNGIQDPGEPGLPGVTVRLLDSAGSVLATTTSAADGSYRLAKLLPGNYVVHWTAPAGYAGSPEGQGTDPTRDSDADPTTGRTAVIALRGVDNLTLDAGFSKRLAIGDFVWNDSNGNGIQDSGEPGLGGVAIRLLDSSGNVLQTTASAADGSYRFGQLAPGSYFVAFTAPAGLGFTLANQGGDAGKDSNADPATGRSGGITLGSADELTIDAGCKPSGLAIGDFVWEDSNGNGVQDPGEPGIGGVALELLDGNSGSTLQTTTSGPDGSYRFENLVPGSYVVQLTAPAGFVFTAKAKGPDRNVDSDVEPSNGHTDPVLLVPGGSSFALDAGLYRPVSIRGFVWDDGDGDGIQGETERGIAGLPLDLLDASGKVVATGSSDPGGMYRFDGLAPGVYALRVTRPPGQVLSPRTQGTDAAKDSDVDPQTGLTALLSLRSGESRSQVDAGLFQPLTEVVSSPRDGERGVALTRETILHLSSALSPAAGVDGSKLFAEFGGNRLAAQIHLAPDRRTITLFYGQPLPASARIRVTLVGDGLANAFGNDLDADGDGEPGGVAHFDFETLSLTTVPGTRVCGRVFASELAPGNSGSSVNVPLTGVTISVDGNEALRASADSAGNFCLDPAPAGRFFVRIDGRTATQGVPAGSYYPTVGKAWESIAGQQVNLGDIFLPLVPAGTLQPVDLTVDTTIHFTPAVLAAFPDLAATQILVPADSLYADDGTRGGKVGIAPVPPDRLPGKLPPGLHFPLVITVQTDGPTNFDKPVAVCFPNLADPTTGVQLSPGAKSALWSFDHDTGQFEIVGPMTVSEDGRRVCTDPGIGILAPGWHGSQPGTPGDPPVDPAEPQPEPPEKPEPEKKCDRLKVVSKVATLAKTIAKLGAELIPITKEVKCGLAVLDSALGLIGDIRSTAEHPNETQTCKALKAFDNSGRRVVETLDACLPGAELKDAENACTSLSDLLNGLSTEGELANCFGGTIPPPLIQWAKAGADLVATAASVKKKIDKFLNPKELLRDLLFQLGEKLKERACDDEIAASRTGFRPTAKDIVVDPELAALLNQIADALEQGTMAAADLPAADVSALSGQVAITSAANDQLGRPFLKGVSQRIPNTVFIKVSYGTIVQRFKGNGTTRLFLPPNLPVTVAVYDPITQFIDVEDTRTSESGQISKFGGWVLSPETDAVDTDGDGLSDLAESILGTDPQNADTDGDGLPDGAEVAQGTDPLDGIAVRTGVTAAVQTSGPAVDICAVNNMAMIAQSQAGLAVFNVFNGLNPTIVAQIDTPGTALAVACAGNLAAVADGTAGLAVVDLTDPPAAKITHQVDLGGTAQAVTVAANVAYVGLGSGQVVSVDMLSGSILETVQVGGAVQDLAIGGETLYVLTPGTLSALPLYSGPLQVAETVAEPGLIGVKRLRLFVGGARAYVTHTQGYDTFDLALPTQPVLLANGVTTQFGWRQIVLNGSGLGIAAVGNNSTTDGDHSLALYDTSDPAKTDVFLLNFDPPTNATAVAIYNGIAYVADGDGGLKVVTYLPYDNRGVAPTITLSTNFADGMAEEGKVMRLTADVRDDVQVKNVEFFVDGVRVLTDGNFPFEHRFVTPPLHQQAAFSLQACATDTGGNRTCTAPRTVQLTQDATPPRVVAVTPANNASFGQRALAALAVTFSEPVDPATVSGTSFTLTAAGPDGILDTLDDVPVQGGAVSYRDDILTAFLTLSGPLPAELYRATVTKAITDRAGNPLTAAFTWTFRVRGPLSWINPAGGLFSDPANWSLGVVPGTSDIAFIALAGNYTVVVDRSVNVGTLTLGTPAGGPTLWVTGNSSTGSVTLTVGNDFNSSGTLRLESRSEGFSSQVTVGGLFTNTGTINVEPAAGGSPSANIKIGIKTVPGSGGPRVLSGNLNNLGQLNVDTSLILSTANGVYSNESLIRIAAGQTLSLNGQGQVLNQNNGTVSGTGALQISNAVLNFNGGTFDTVAPVVKNGTLNLGPVATGGASFVLTGNSTLSGNLAASQSVWVRGDGATGDTTVTAAAGFTNAGTLRLESQDNGFAANLTVTNGLLTNTGTIISNVGSNGSRTLSADLANSGLLTVNQTLTLSKQDGVYSNQGQLAIAADQQLLMSGEDQVFNQNGGVITATGSFEISSATLNFNNGTLGGNPVVLRNAALSIGPLSTGAASFILAGTSTLSGNVGASQNLWIRGDNSVGDTTVTAAAGFTNAGLLRLESQDQNFSSNLTLTNGTLTNTGTLDVNPGSGGSRNLTGNLSNQGSLSFPLGGTAAGSGYARLNVSGLATLAGTLNVTLGNNFTPSLGQTFQLLTYGSRSGTFTTLAGTDLGGGLRLDPSYGSTALTLTVVTP